MQMVPFSIPLGDQPQGQIVLFEKTFGPVIKCHVFAGFANVLVTAAAGSHHPSLEAAMGLAYHVILHQAMQPLQGPDQQGPQIQGSTVRVEELQEARVEEPQGTGSTTHR